jgi:hypothetical protein
LGIGTAKGAKDEDDNDEDWCIFPTWLLGLDLGGKGICSKWLILTVPRNTIASLELAKGNGHHNGRFGQSNINNITCGGGRFQINYIGYQILCFYH